MNQSIRIRGREYAVSAHDRTNSTTQEIETGYKFTGKRGAQYFTMRNVKHPHRMFVVSMSLGSTVMDGVWVTDESGSLSVISQ